MSDKLKECKCGQVYWKSQKKEHKKTDEHKAYQIDEERELDNPLDFGLAHPKPTLKTSKVENETIKRDCLCQSMNNLAIFHKRLYCGCSD